MCGICGKLNFDEEVNVEERLITRMAATLVHRGPDDEGVYVKNTIGLGHRRLSVIDLSEAAHQPMSNEDGTRWIVFNGEIYNFLELRKELTRILNNDDPWDGKVNVLQVTNATDRIMEIRALVSAENSPAAWDLRVNVREKLLEFLQKNYPETLPKTRLSLDRIP